MYASRFFATLSLLFAFALAAPVHAAEKLWVTYPGKDGPGKGKKVVFLTGDEEYRSEEGLPQLARILAERHGFTCTVLFSINPAGEIDPATKDNIPGMEALDTADACVMLLRFRELPDAQMKHFVDYVDAGKPIIALRTSTHAFKYEKNPGSPYAKYSYDAKGEWPGGFGKHVLGETWVNHWGAHKKEGTRAMIDPAGDGHPALTTVSDIFCTTDVYEAHPPSDVLVLLRGEVTTGLEPTDPPVKGAKNNPQQPIAWIRDADWEPGKNNPILCTTMGAATDLLNDGLRRLIVNAVYWATQLSVQPELNVDLVGDYKPSEFGFDGAKKGVRPKDLQ